MHDISISCFGRTFAPGLGPDGLCGLLGSKLLSVRRRGTDKTRSCPVFQDRGFRIDGTLPKRVFMYELKIYIYIVLFTVGLCGRATD